MELANITLWVAFLAGIAAFFSPCIIPVLPGFFAFLGGSAVQKNSRWKIFGNTLIFAFGFATAFALIGMSVRFLGTPLAVHKELFQRIGGVLFIIFGLMLLDIIPLPAVNPGGIMSRLHSSSRVMRDLLLGATFGFASLACTGPIWGSILFLATGEATARAGMWLLIFFSLGLTIPFLICSLFVPEVKKMLKKLSRIAKYTHHIMGWILILTGIAFFFGWLDVFAGWVLQVIK